MAEFLPRGNLTTSKLLETCTKQALPSGDILYTSTTYLDTGFLGQPDSPFQMMVSPIGQTHLERDSNLLTLADSSYYIPYGTRNYTDRDGSSRTTKETLLTTQQAVSVKRFLSWSSETGLSQFRAVRILGLAGVLCPTPILATRWRLISDWVDAKPGQGKSQELLEYAASLQQAVEGLRTDGLWDNSWELDLIVKGDFFVRDLRARNPLERFYAIDPIKLRET